MSRVVFLAALCLAGCAATRDYTWVDQLSEGAFVPEPYRLQPGDFVSVTVWGHANLSSDVRIRPDGNATLPLLNDLAAAGLTPSDWAAQIQRALAQVVVDPKVTVTVKEASEPTVSVIGEVRRVGEYPLRSSDSILELVARAGGMTEFASPSNIYVVRRRPNFMRVRFTYNDLARGAGRALLFRLQSGDVIVVE